MAYITSTHRNKCLFLHDTEIWGLFVMQHYCSNKRYTLFFFFFWLLWVFIVGSLLLHTGFL